MGYETAAFGKVAHGQDVKRWGFSHFDLKFDLNLVRQYVSDRKGDKPLCLFVGTHDPHVPWEKNRDYDASQVKLPGNFVDTPQTREYRSDYYTEVTRADTDMGALRDFVRQQLAPIRSSCSPRTTGAMAVWQVESLRHQHSHPVARRLARRHRAPAGARTRW